MATEETTVRVTTAIHRCHNRLKMKRRAQSIIEYTIIIAAVAAAFMAMRVYLQRSVQSSLTSMDDYLTPKPLE